MIPQFATKQERFAWLRLNKDIYTHAKKSAIKYADAVSGVNTLPDGVVGNVAKELGNAAPPANGIMYVKAVINTTGLMDSHMDVHIPGIWKKSLSEVKTVYHLQEHDMKFDKVISDDVTAYTKPISWKSMGYDYEGSTQALVFDSAIKQARNPFMYEQYASGYVKNHSVGMRYVKLFMCVDSTDKWWAEEKENWDKYIDNVINKEAAEDLGMFWAVTEAKVIEGSAVLVGSNPATPTLEVSEAGFKSTSANDPEPDKSTQADYSFLSRIKLY
jgi:hypothetical protein